MRTSERLPFGYENTYSGAARSDKLSPPAADVFSLICFHEFKSQAAGRPAPRRSAVCVFVPLVVETWEVPVPNCRVP